MLAGLSIRHVSYSDDDLSYSDDDLQRRRTLRPNKKADTKTPTEKGTPNPYRAGYGSAVP